MAELCLNTFLSIPIIPFVIPCILGYALVSTLSSFYPPQAWNIFSAHVPCKIQKKKHVILKKHHQVPAKQSLETKPITPEYVLGFDPYSPEFANQLMAAFRQESLAYRLKKNENSHTVVRNLGTNKKKNHTKKNTKAKEILWVNQIMQDVSHILPFHSNLDLGSNSTSDVYVQLSAAKTWSLFSHWSLDTTQTFRYGAQSKNYSETAFNFSQKNHTDSSMNNQLSVVKTYESHYNWSDKLFMKKKLWLTHQLTYGLYTGGIYNQDKKEVELKSWGPYLGWRLPLWRTWLYLDNDVSYYKDSNAIDGYSFNVNLQLEAIF